MIVKVKHEVYGETELNVERVIAICPKTNRLLFEDTIWKLDDDFRKVANAWREIFDNGNENIKKIMD